LSGEPPFGGCGGPETLMQVRDNILRGDFIFAPVEAWQAVSIEAKEFILSLLVIDPMDRPTARQAKESRWLRMWSNRENIGNEEDKMINPNVVKALVPKGLEDGGGHAAVHVRPGPGQRLQLLANAVHWLKRQRWRGVHWNYGIANLGE